MKLDSIPVLRVLTRSSGWLTPVGLFAVAFGIAAALLAPLPAWDMDVWWIAAAGREIARTHHFPQTNLFSFAEPDRPWILHEGLYAVLFQAALTRLGPGFFSLFGFLSACATVGAVLAGTIGRARHTTSAVALAGVVVLGLSNYLVSPRPLYASALFAVTLTLIAFAPRFSSGSIATALAIEWVWTNAHGSFPLGVALLAVGALQHVDRRRRLFAAALSALVTFANPYGWRMYSLIARYVMGSDDASALIRSHLGGFAPMWRMPSAFIDAGVVCAFVAVTLAAFVSLGMRSCRLRGLVALTLLAFGIAQSRHAALAVLVSCVLVAPAVDSWFAKPEAPLPSRLASSLRVALALTPGLLTGLQVIASEWATRSSDDWIGMRVGGPAFARLARTLPDGARVHAPFAATGLLLWLDAPRGVRILYDARNDCYSADLVAAGFALDDGSWGEARSREFLERSGVDRVLVQVGSPLFHALSATPAWTARAKDETWVALTPDDSTPGVLPDP